MSTTIIIGFVQALFFAFLALAKKKKDESDYMLALLFFTLCIQLGVNFVTTGPYQHNFPHFIGVAGPFSFLYGPLLFFFIKDYISDESHLKLKYLWHFIPFLVNHIYNFFALYFLSGSEKIAELNEITSGKPDAATGILLLLRSLSPLVYSIWSLWVLKRHRKDIKNLFSFSSTQLKLEWLWYLTISMFLVSISAMSLNIIIVFFDVADWVQLRMIIFVIASFWVFFLGYYSVRKTPFYRSYPVEYASIRNAEKKEDKSAKYEKTKLKTADIPVMKQKLLDHLAQEKPYLNSNLTIAQLAAPLDIPAYQLSQLINEHFGQTFFELINTYRVEELKKRLLDEQYKNLTLLGIAMECGFNSKASFNRIFKQLTGQTPSQYIKERSVA